MSGTHDSGYKLLFSHPQMIRDLLLGFVPGAWVSDADFSSLEQINGNYVADSLRQRHDDLVWRVRIRGRWLWIYLALEFQSDPDPWMAVRMMVYTGLLAQQLIRTEQLHQGQIPPILPIVLYNGSPVWTAATNVANCFASPPAGLEPHRPSLLYYLLDQARLNLHPVAAVRNFSEALFRLEQGRTVPEVRQVLQALDLMLRDPELQSLRRAFGVWVKSLLRRKAPPPSLEEINQINDIMEADSMLAERIEGWFEDVWKKGLQEGMQQGEARVLARILARRFGELPPWVHDRLAVASEQELEAWVDAALTAQSVEAVFGPPQ